MSQKLRNQIPSEHIEFNLSRFDTLYSNHHLPFYSVHFEVLYSPLNVTSKQLFTPKSDFVSCTLKYSITLIECFYTSLKANLVPCATYADRACRPEYTYWFSPWVHNKRIHYLQSVSVLPSGHLSTTIDILIILEQKSDVWNFSKFSKNLRVSNNTIFRFQVTEQVSSSVAWEICDFSTQLMLYPDTTLPYPYQLNERH